MEYFLKKLYCIGSLLANSQVISMNLQWAYDEQKQKTPYSLDYYDSRSPFIVNYLFNTLRSRDNWLKVKINEARDGEEKAHAARAKLFSITVSEWALTIQLVVHMIVCVN